MKRNLNGKEMKIRSGQKFPRSIINLMVFPKLFRKLTKEISKILRITLIVQNFSYSKILRF